MSPSPSSLTAAFSTLELASLPNEIVHHILRYLPPLALANFGVTSKKNYCMATPLLYHSIELTDRTRGSDDHDDTPMLKMLLLFIRNPFLASQVRELSHQCHLKLPDCNRDLLSMTFSGFAMPTAARTRCYLRRAIRNLSGVHTLRIILGHEAIVEALIGGFFDSKRKPTVRRLWIESSSIENLEDILNSQNRPLSLTGLESVRIRRLSLFPIHLQPRRGVPLFGLARDITSANHGMSITYDNTLRHEWGLTSYTLAFRREMRRLDDLVFQGLPMYPELVSCGTDAEYDDVCFYCTHYLSCCACERTINSNPPLQFLGSLVELAHKTLRSLAIDWVLGGQQWVELLADSPITFPNLRALQLRGAVQDGPKVTPSEGTFLLGPKWGKFLKRHSKVNLQCLGWPMELFLAHGSDNAMQTTISGLGKTLKELRIERRICQDLDHPEEGNLVDKENGPNDAELRRRAFRTTFATRMKAVEVLKIEGSCSYHERVEIMRAMENCPLRKVVVIAIQWAVQDAWMDIDLSDQTRLLANTWPISGRPGVGAVPQTSVDISGEPAYSETSTLLEFRHPQGAPDLKHYDNDNFLGELALHHASTITELKLCGFVSAPVLYDPSPSAHHHLSFLKPFLNLAHLTTAFALPTYWDRHNIANNVGYLWDMRHHQTNASANTTSNAAGEDLPAREAFLDRLLHKYYEPSALVAAVVALLVPKLHPLALARGMTVKALFILKGIRAMDLYELIIRLGPGGAVLGFIGPRGDGDPEKEREKLMARGWF